MGYSLYKAKNIDVFMVEGAGLNVECKLVREIILGDHITFIGEAVNVKIDTVKEPLVYHNGQYWKLGEPLQKPTPETMDLVNKTVAKYKKSAE